MDEKGFGYTFDAVLALIPIIIFICGVTNLPIFHDPPNHTGASQKAQDVMDFMAQYRPNGEMSVLETLSTTLESGNNDKESVEHVREISSIILNKNFPKMEYILIEENRLGGEILAGRLDIENTNNVATASRNCGNYTYRVYVK